MPKFTRFLKNRGKSHVMLEKITLCAISINMHLEQEHDLLVFLINMKGLKGKRVMRL